MGREGAKNILIILHDLMSPLLIVDQVYKCVKKAKEKHIIRKGLKLPATVFLVKKAKTELAQMLSNCLCIFSCIHYKHKKTILSRVLGIISTKKAVIVVQF